MLGGMRKQGDIRALEDEGFLASISRASVAVLAAGALAVAALSAALAALAPAALDAPLRPLLGAGPGASALPWLAAGAAGVAASLAAHELVHGALFKLLAPAGARVSFGADLRAGMLYAVADGVVFTRRRYLAALLAPTAAVTAACAALSAALGCPVMGLAVAVLHLAGCTGDWGYARAILADPSITHCEDTSWGVRFYAAGDVGAPAGGGRP